MAGEWYFSEDELLYLKAGSWMNGFKKFFLQLVLSFWPTSYLLKE